VKALVLRLSSVGDVVHTLPAAAALRRHGFEVGWAVEPTARPLLEGNPVVARVHAVPSARRSGLRGALPALRSLRAERYDAALDFQGLWKSALWGRLAGARRLAGYGRAHRREGASAALLGAALAPPPGARHVIDLNLGLLRALGIDAVGLREFPLPALAPEEARMGAWLGQEGLARFVLLAPGGGWESKLWPAARYGELAATLAARGLPAVVAWGPGEEERAGEVVLASAGAARLAPPTSLRELVALLRRARLVVGADTGPLHLACAVRTPVVGLFGPTDPGRNGPFDEADAVVRRAPPCAPCHRRECPRHAGVMRGIAVAEVLEAAARRLASGPAARTVAL
jgi:lipopolysaccharide heptosyltransferase I